MQTGIMVSGLYSKNTRANLENVSSVWLTVCSGPENIQTHPKVNRNSKGEGGVQSPIFKGKYDTNLEFPEG